MIKICICWGGAKLQPRHCICFPIEYILPQWFIPGPGPVEHGIDVGGLAVGPELRAVAGLAALKGMKGIGRETQVHLEGALEQATKALQAKLPEGFEMHVEGG